MARPVTIFGDLSRGSIFFQGTRIRPAPLGGVVVAIEHPSPVHAGKIRVTRSDLFQRNGVDPRVIFKRMLPTRVKNKAGQFLVGDLGFSTAQVIDYINDQANKKSNEIDIQNNGALVGGGTTLNFKGAIDFITVSDDVANICIDQVGIATTGGYVGTGVTLFDFRGSGVSTVTDISAGVATIFIEGGTSTGVADTHNVSTSTLNVVGVATASGGFIGTIRSSDVVGLVTAGQIQSIAGSQITGTIDSTQLSPHITGLGGVNFTLGDSIAQPAFDLTNATDYPYSSLTGIPSSSGGGAANPVTCKWCNQVGDRIYNTIRHQVEMCTMGKGFSIILLIDSTNVDIDVNFNEKYNTATVLDHQLLTSS